MRPRWLPKIIPLLVMAGLAGCTPAEPWSATSPELAMNAFLTALNVSDYETVWEFLDGPTRDRLTAAHHARAQALGEDSATDGVTILASTLFRVWTPSPFHIDRLETTERDEEHAIIVIHDIFGGETPISMTRSAGRWALSLTETTVHGARQ